MKDNKISKNIIDILSSVGFPVISGGLFIVWVIYFIKNPVITFPLISIIVLDLYYFSGRVHAGVLASFASASALLGIAFIDDGFSSFLVLLEGAQLVAFYFVLKMYDDHYISMKNRMQEEYETLDREITLKDSEIKENSKRTEAIIQQMDNFQTLGRIIQTFEASLDEREIIYKSGELASKFIGNGEWKLKKNVYGDVFAKYIKTSGIPLIITDFSTDRRFPMLQNKDVSVIAVPVDVNGSFWGILIGTSPGKNAFRDSDLRLLSILSGIISAVLNNAYLYVKIQELAITDGLTGLYTQSYFKERLKEEMKRARSNKVPLSVAVLDIDFFKKINDRYGHRSGDVILSQVAALLRGRFRETDLLSRYGGEEFGVIMLHTDDDEAVKILEEVRAGIEKERFFLPIESYSPIQVKITVSIGFAGLEVGGTAAVEDELIKKADKALYKAKNSGRNRTVRYANEQ
ncbi:MAG: sensor domain-containing diguanylate cyclase [Endomicrobium sp.]|jgi:diguanylate cyclase (GGDEF)-like protein|nr:sensor domain-containing diguanylate cyclase [Endomicrobium sp.]